MTPDPLPADAVPEASPGYEIREVPGFGKLVLAEWMPCDDFVAFLRSGPEGAVMLHDDVAGHYSVVLCRKVLAGYANNAEIAADWKRRVAAAGRPGK